jgi:hypothetical protein
MNNQEIKIVAEDLEYLRDGWGPDIPEPDIRRGSAILRRLLVESAFSEAWRSAGFKNQPKIIAVDLLNFVDENYLKDIECCLAWGANFRGGFMLGPCITRNPMSQKMPPPGIRADGFPGEREFTIPELMESIAGISEGKAVKRREIIKYIANVKGGIHLRSKKRKEEIILIKKIEKFENRINAHTSDGLLVETVAIAQAVGQSDDANKLINYAKSI